jgi:hypothetical protein
MDPENWNVGKAWSEMDLFDLKNHLAQGCSVEETAEFLMRSEREVREKMAELGLSKKQPGNSGSLKALQGHRTLCHVGVRRTRSTREIHPAA